MSHTMLFEHRDDIVVVVNDERVPTEREWEHYLASCRELFAKYNRQRIIVRSAGGGPNFTQRRSINAAFEGRPQRVAVLIPTIARGIVTALSWFNPLIRAFKLNEPDAAIAHLGLDSEQAKWARATLERLLHQLAALRDAELGVKQR